MADIPVNLKAKVDAASVQAAGKQMGETVRRSAGSSIGGLASNVKGLSPTSQELEKSRHAELARRKIVERNYEWAQQRRREAATAAAASMKNMALALTAVIATIRGFGIVTSSITNALSRASSFYAKSLTSGGAPLGFTTQKSIIANAMGVSEERVFEYGEAFAYLNNEMKGSIAIQSANAKKLTESSYKWKSAGESVNAFFSTIAHGIKTLGGDSGAGFLTKMISRLNAKMNQSWSELDNMKLAMEFRNEKGIKTNRGVDNILAMLHNATAKQSSQLIPTKGMQMKETISSPEFKEWLKNRKGFPDPTISSKRLQSSSWERMGLVIGQGVNSNPLKATERNTRQTAVLLKDIRAFLSPRSSATGPRLDRTAVNGA